MGSRVRLFEAPKIQRSLPLPATEVAEKRVDTIVSTATEGDWEQGMGWYQSAHDFASELAAKGGAHLTTRHVAGIIAALSPMRSWTENVQNARQVVEGKAIKGLGHTIMSSRLIVLGFDPDVVLDTGENFKVMSFFDNIANPTTSNRVTIDRHMWTLLTNDFKIVDKADLYFKAHEYEWAAERVRTVAERHGAMPHQIQAVAWLAWRRKQGIIDPAPDPNQGLLEFS